MDSSRFDPRRWLNSARARLSRRSRAPRPWHPWGGEGGRESEGRDQGGPSLSDAQRHIAERVRGLLMHWTWNRPSIPEDPDRDQDLQFCTDRVFAWCDAPPTVDEMWYVRDVLTHYGFHDDAEAILWRIRCLTDPGLAWYLDLDPGNAKPTPPAAAGPDAHAWDPPRSGSPCSGTPSNSNPGPVSPGLERQNTQTDTRNGGNSVW